LDISDILGAGSFYGIGLGPGDPELLTRKAVRVLSQADVIFLPAAKKSGMSMAGTLVRALQVPEDRFRPVSLCMARARGEDQQAYERVADEIAAELKQGKSAAWISEGDPSLYSTFGHLFTALRSRHPHVKIEIIPGVSSLQAAAARAGLPIAHLDETVAIIPAAYGIDRLPVLLREFATVFLVKVNSVFDRLLEVLESCPEPLASVYVEHVSTPRERLVTDLRSLRGQELPYFSLVMIRSQGKPRRLEDAPSGLGAVYVIGLGPGRRELLTSQSREALRRCQVVVGYSGYFSDIEDLLAGKDCHRLELGQEAARARLAVEQAQSGRAVALISSGDPGIYGMASVLLEALESLPPERRPEVVIVPGISAVNAAASLLGAPLGHDFAVISLSDLLTPWQTIEKRLTAAAEADFVVALLNPHSRRRDWQLARAREILLRYRSPENAVGIVRNAYRADQAVEVTTLARMQEVTVDMFTTVIVGNSQTRCFQSTLVTPRNQVQMQHANG
jgi:precorrin-2 C20-methyltransferase/precorrin-3B C17-methyltransferase